MDLVKTYITMVKYVHLTWNPHIGYGRWCISTFLEVSYCSMRWTTQVSIWDGMQYDYTLDRKIWIQMGLQEYSSCWLDRALWSEEVELLPNVTGHAETGSYMHLLCYAIMLACTMESLYLHTGHIYLSYWNRQRCSRGYEFNFWIQIWLEGMSLFYYRFERVDWCIAIKVVGSMECGNMWCAWWTYKQGVKDNVNILKSMKKRYGETYDAIWSNMEDKYGGY